MTTNVQTPLWQQLQHVSHVICAVENGRSGTAELAKIDTRLRAGVQAICFEVWRNLGRAKALRALLIARRPDAMVDALLCTAMALLCKSEQGGMYEDHTLVNQTVEAAKRLQYSAAQSSFINACLRRFLREKERLIATTEKNNEAMWNHPSWWIKKVQRDWPNHWSSILTHANSHAAMVLRTNRRKTTAVAYQDRLHQAGMACTVHGDATIVLHTPVAVDLLPEFHKGLVSVQDGAAQLATTLLLSQAPSPKRILDACAAPGGKTGDLLERTSSEVWALDIDQKRVIKIRENLERLQLPAKVVVGSVLSPNEWWDGIYFDAILFDAPCSASGVVRRHPDIRWLRRESDIEKLAATQKEMLEKLWPMLAVGGFLLYCTCSIFPEEGGDLVLKFIDGRSDLKVWPTPGHLLPYSVRTIQEPQAVQSLDNDGFYYALLQKTS
jgi:16S rRNA (cytosine967-C5)-methyltransferase